jgi:hypothetical protein
MTILATATPKIMQPIKALIVDDEFQSRKFLHSMLLQYFPEISVIYQASSVEELITVSFQAIKAALMNPVESLRVE